MVTSRDRFRGRSPATTLLLLVATGIGACQHGQSSETAGAAPPRPEAGGTILERDEIMEDAVSNVIELIEGRLSGVRVVRSGGGVWFEIRGPGTVSGNPEALVIIDGVDSSARELLAMNPEDVERIQVLKGAAAGRYGIRGGNGALVITTRRAR